MTGSARSTGRHAASSAQRPPDQLLGQPQQLGVLFDDSEPDSRYDVGPDEAPDRSRSGAIALVTVVAALVVAVLGVALAILRQSDSAHRRQAGPLPLTAAPSQVVSRSLSAPAPASVPPSFNALPPLPTRPVTSTHAASTAAHASSPAPSATRASGVGVAPPPRTPTASHRPPPPHSSAPASDTVLAARGTRYRGAGCAGRCFYLQVQLHGFASGAHLVQCRDAQTGIVRSSTTTSATDLPQACWGPRHESLIAVVDDRVVSRVVTL